MCYERLSTGNKRSLLIGITQPCFFLIPDDHVLLEGDFILRSLLGSEQSVDPEAIAAYEVTEEEAKQFVMDQLSGALEEARRAFSQYLAMLAIEARKREQEQAAAAEAAEVEAAEAPTPAPAMPIVTDLLGFAPAELQEDPEAAQEKLESLFRRLNTFLDQAFSEEPQEQEAAREQMRALRGKLADHGIETSERFERIPDRIREQGVEGAREEDRRRLAAAFQELANTISEGAAAFSRELEERLAELEHEDEQG